MNTKKLVERNIKIDYVYRFISSFNLTDAIWVLYLASKGLTLWEIGLLEGIFHIASMIFELPTGVMADLLGRKKTIILGRVTNIISAILMIGSNSFLGFVIAFIFTALSYNLNSGSEEALIYDSLLSLNREKDYLKINGKLNFIIEISTAIAVFIGGLVSEISFELAYLIVIVVSTASLISTFFFHEIETKKSSETNVNKICVLKSHFLICKNVICRQPHIRRVLFFYPIVTSFRMIVYYYGQQHFNNIGLNKIQIAMIMLFHGCLASIGALLTTKVDLLFHNNSSKWIATFMSITVIAFGSKNATLILFSFFALAPLNAMLENLSSDKMNALIPSKQRATLLSLNSIIFSVAMILIFPLCGWFGDQFGLNRIFMVMGTILIVFAILFPSLPQTIHDTKVQDTTQLQ